MLQAWQTTLKYEVPTVPGVRYKQTAITTTNGSSAPLDGNGYCVSSISVANGPVTIKYTVNAGNEVAIQYRMTRSTSVNSAVYVEYQAGTRICLPGFNAADTNMSFQGGSYPVTYTSNKVDVKFVLDFTNKVAKLYLATTLGGPFALIASAAFTTLNVSSTAIQIWHYGPGSRFDNLLVTNNGSF